MQILCRTCSVILNVTATQYSCSLNSIYLPHWLVQWSHHCLLQSIAVHAHSSPLSLAARLHRCHANHSCYINCGWTFSGQISYLILLKNQSFWRSGKCSYSAQFKVEAALLWNSQPWFSWLTAVYRQLWKEKNAALLRSPSEWTTLTVSLISTSSPMAFTWFVFSYSNINLNNAGFRRPSLHIILCHKWSWLILFATLE